jgi:hypothetical protein
MLLYGQNKQMKEYTTAKLYQTSKSGDKMALKGYLSLSPAKSDAHSMITVSPDTMY